MEPCARRSGFISPLAPPCSQEHSLWYLSGLCLELGFWDASKGPLPLSVLSVPRGVKGAVPSSPGHRGGASLLHTSLLGEIRDPSFTSSFQATVFPVGGLEWEREAAAGSLAAGPQGVGRGRAPRARSLAAWAPGRGAAWAPGRGAGPGALRACPRPAASAARRRSCPGAA